MANIVKITNVDLYTGMVSEQEAVEEVRCRQLLKQNNIPFNHLHYGDESVHEQNFKALSTWTFGSDFQNYDFKKFPIVMWKEYYDDYERFHQVVTSFEDLKNSSLLKNIDKVVREK